MFTEDVGLEPGSVVAELGGFPVKEVKFRRDMEKLRNSQQRDLTLHKVSLLSPLTYWLVKLLSYDAVCLTLRDKCYFYSYLHSSFTVCCF